MNRRILTGIVAVAAIAILGAVLLLRRAGTGESTASTASGESGAGIDVENPGAEHVRSTRLETSDEAVRSAGSTVPDTRSDSIRPPTDAAVRDEDRWLADTATMGPEELDLYRQTLENDLRIASEPVFEARFGSGMYEDLGTGNTFRSEHWESDKVMRVEVPGTDGGSMKKVVLEEREFPEFYRMHRQIAWLRTRAQELRTGLREKFLAGNPR